MSVKKKPQTVLIPGAGPVSMGQGNEYDGAIVQAIQVLRSEGHKSVVLDANPATRMTDGDQADVVYLEPPTIENMAEVIQTEKVDAILTGMGGPLGLHGCAQLSENGFIEQHRLTLLGTGQAALAAWSHRSRFTAEIQDLGFQTPDSRPITSFTEAEAAAAQIGLPLLVRRPTPSTPMQMNPGNNLVYNREELRESVDAALAESRPGRIVLEASLEGWQELEFIGLRDGSNGTKTVCLIENVDPMGIHGGDSICVTPPQTVSADTAQKLYTCACQVMERLAIVGCASIRFALSPDGGNFMVVGFTPGMTRSAAMAAMVHGIALPAITTRLICGLGLDGLPRQEQSSLDSLDSTLPPTKLAVRMPHWDFDRFEGAQKRLGPQMQSTGEAVGIATSFTEALSKALRALGLDDLHSGAYNAKTSTELLNLLGSPRPDRLFILHAALRQELKTARIAERSHIQPWFIDQLRMMVALEGKIENHRGGLPPDDLLLEAKGAGLSDAKLANLLGVDLHQIHARLQAKGYGLRWPRVLAPKDTTAGPVSTACYGEFGPLNGPGDTADDARLSGEGQKILLVGPGPNRIGLGAGIDHTLLHVARTLKKSGTTLILANADALSHAGDPEVADRYYFAPITLEDILAIYRLERPDGVLLQFGGEAALGLIDSLTAEGARIIGSRQEMLALGADPIRLKELITSLGIPQPESGMAVDLNEAAALADKIGYPVVIRSRGRAYREERCICVDRSGLEAHIGGEGPAEGRFPVVIEQFLEFAIEIEVDALGDGEDAYVPAAMEQIELAGVHFGNSACVTPPYSTALRHIESILEYSRKMASAMEIEGLFKLRFCYYQDAVYLLEIRLGSSRTVPVVSKLSKVPMAAMAARLVLGAKIDDVRPRETRLPRFAIREAALPFGRFPQVDPVMGAEIQATGEVLATADSFGMAYFKSQEAVGSPLPTTGTVLVTITDEDKPSILEPVRLFKEMGFAFKATRGTCDFLNKNGIAAQPVRKLGFGRPDLLDEIKSGNIDVVINTPSGRQSQMDDSYIRKAAIRHKIPNITTPAGAVAAALGIMAARRQQTAGRQPLTAFHREEQVAGPKNGQE